MARSYGPTYLKRTIRYNSMRKGLLGDSRPWMVMFFLLKLARWSGKVTKRGEAPIRFSESLASGQSYVITHLDRQNSSTTKRR